MSDNEISAKLKQFVFDSMDSVEQTEVLVFLCNNPDSWYTPFQISEELRSNPTSILNRLLKLEKIGMVENDKILNRFRFLPSDNEHKEIAIELAREYQIRRHTIIELIFSSSKNIKKFADAFILKPNKKERES